LFDGMIDATITDRGADPPRQRVPHARECCSQDSRHSFHSGLLDHIGTVNRAACYRCALCHHGWRQCRGCRQKRSELGKRSRACIRAPGRAKGWLGRL